MDLDLAQALSVQGLEWILGHQAHQAHQGQGSTSWVLASVMQALGFLTNPDTETALALLAQAQVAQARAHWVQLALVLVQLVPLPQLVQGTMHSWMNSGVKLDLWVCCQILVNQIGDRTWVKRGIRDMSLWTQSSVSVESVLKMSNGEENALECWKAATMHFVSAAFVVGDENVSRTSRT